VPRQLSSGEIRVLDSTGSVERYSVQRHESKAVNAATMVADDELFLTGGSIRSPELIEHAEFTSA
jgi:hypothetical protein